MSEIQNSSPWFGLPDDPYFNSPKGNSIRAWTPGDGLMCSSGRQGRTAVQCGVPVAVIATGEGEKYQRARVRNVCAIHAATLVRQLMREQRAEATIKTDAQRIARERVLAAHWDEYQAAIDDAIFVEQEKAFAWLPDELREAILSNEEDAK